MKKILAFVLCIVLIIPIGTSNTILSKEKKVEDDALSVTAVSAVLIEGTTGEILFEKDKDKELVPASITKIMTLILIFEAIDSGKIKLEDSVTVSEYAASMGGSQVFLEPGETQTVNNMIKCISIASANDASAAMAEHIAGSETEFVKRMNKKAQELGMKHTNFKNCSGLDDDIKSGHFSSAYDVALMSRELITKHPQISNYSTVWMDTITHVTKKGESEFGLTNTNKLVRFYKGITGLKTGSTAKAKYCLSATANRNGMNLIAVIMAAPDHKARFGEASSLLDYGFANCMLYQDTHDKLKLEPCKISNGDVRNIEVAPEHPFSYTFTKTIDEKQIKSEIKYYDSIKAPIKKGDSVGEITYTLNKTTLGKVSIVSTINVGVAKYGDMFSQVVNRFFKNID